MTLEPGQHQATVLEAQAHKRDDIAAVVGVSPATINRWRKDDEYQSAIEKLREKDASALSSAIERARLALLDELPTVVSTLRNACDATDGDGHELWRVQTDAATALGNLIKPLIEAGLNPAGSRGEEGGTGPQSAQVIVQVIGDRTPPRADVESTASEA